MTAPQTYPKDSSLQKMPVDQNKNDLDSNLKAIKDGGKNLVDHVKDDAINLAHGIASEGSEKMQEVRAYISGCAKKMEHEVSENPVRSVAVAFAAGYVLNFIFGRR